MLLVPCSSALCTARLASPQTPQTRLWRLEAPVQRRREEVALAIWDWSCKQGRSCCEDGGFRGFSCQLALIRSCGGYVHVEACAGISYQPLLRVEHAVRCTGCRNLQHVHTARRRLWLEQSSNQKHETCRLSW